MHQKKEAPTPCSEATVWLVQNITLMRDKTLFTTLSFSIICVYPAVDKDSQ